MIEGKLGFLKIEGKCESALDLLHRCGGNYPEATFQPDMGRERHIQHENSRRRRIAAGHNHHRTVLAARPRSASHTSPGSGLIENVQYFLLSRSRTHQVEHVIVGEFNYFRDSQADFRGRFRFPLTQLLIQFLG